MKVRLRRFFYLLHLWLGIGLGLHMSLLGLTGTVLVWKAPLERALYSHLFVAQPSTQIAAPSRFLDTVQQAKPEALINRVHLPESPGDTVEVRFTMKEETYFAYLDPQTAKLRGIVTATGTLTGLLLEFHISLLLQNGRWLNTIAALGGCAILLSGLWLWWPSIKRFGSDLKQRVTIKHNTSTKRLIHDLHNVFGIYSLPLLLLAFSTGAIILEMHEPIKNFVYRLTNTPPDIEYAELPKSVVQSPNKPTVDSLFQSASTALPNGKTTHFFPPKKEGTPFRTVVKDHDGPEHGGIAQVLVDPRTGKIIQVIDERQPTRGKKFMSMIAPLHYAEFGGIIVRILYSLAGLMPLALFITGLWKWSGKLRGKAKNRARHQQKSPKEVVTANL